MQIVFVVQDAPYPPRSGAPLRLWQHINVLAAYGDVSVFSVGHREHDASYPGVVKRWLHIDVDEYPENVATGLRRLIKLVRPRQFPLNNDFIQGALNARLRDFIGELSPDVVVLGHWHHAIPTALRRHSRVIVDAHNIESLLLAEAHLIRRSRLGHALANWRFRRRERALFRRASSIWLTSTNDVRLLKKLEPKARQPVVVPNAVDVRSYASVRERTIARPNILPDARRVIGFVGLYAYPPNEKAVDVLIDRVFPTVAAAFEGDARLLLIGKSPTEKMLAASARDARIVVTGAVPEVRPYIALLDVVVVPLAEGGGTRLKILEAFAAGVPVVSTSKGAEGIEAVHGRDIIIANTPSELADAAIALLSDEPRRREQIHNALTLVTEKYSWEAAARIVAQALPSAR